MIESESEYLVFVELSRTGGQKTKRVEVSSKSGNPLGVIAWYGAWRQYCFWPYYDTLFNVGCMNDIVAKIGELMAERRAERRARA